MGVRVSAAARAATAIASPRSATGSRRSMRAASMIEIGGQDILDGHRTRGGPCAGSGRSACPGRRRGRGRVPCSASLSAAHSTPSGSHAAVTVSEANARVGEELEAEGAEARRGPRHRRPDDERGRPSQPSASSSARATSRPKQMPDRGRPGRLALAGRSRGGRGGRGRSAACVPLPRPPRRAARRATMARPGGTIQAFCEPVTTTSRPQASVSKGTAPTPLMPSTRMRASGTTARALAARASIGFVDPGRGLVVGQQDGSWRPACGDHRLEGGLNVAGSAAVPHSTSSRVTSAP